MLADARKTSTNHSLQAANADLGLEGAFMSLSLVERVPKPLRILYSIKLGFLYRLNKQINERFIYEKVNVYIYYSLETDVPALQGAHTAACSVPIVRAHNLGQIQSGMLGWHQAQ